METYDVENYDDAIDGDSIHQCEAIDAEIGFYQASDETDDDEPAADRAMHNEEMAPVSAADTEIDRVFEQIRSLNGTYNNGHKATFDEAMNEILKVYESERQDIIIELKAGALFQGDEALQAAQRALVDNIERYLKDKRPVVGFAAYLRFHTAREIRQALKTFQAKETNEEAADATQSEEIARLWGAQRDARHERQQQTAEIDRLYPLYNSVGSKSEKHSIGLKIMSRIKGRISNNISRYLNLSHAVDAEDLEQLSFVAVFAALRSFDYALASKMKFSTYLDWFVRKEFQKNISAHDKEVEIYYRDGGFKQTLEYNEFVKKVRMIRAAGMSYVQKSRVVAYADEFVPCREEASAEQALVEKESNEYYRANLLPELYEMYSKGLLTEGLVEKLADAGKEYQTGKLKEASYRNT